MWVSAQAFGVTSGGTISVTASCPSGYLVVSGGVDLGGGALVGDVINGPQYQVLVAELGFSPNHVTVTAWCALSTQVSVTVVDRSLTTTQSGGGFALGDFACDGDMTPVGASLVHPTGSAFYIDQSGPETIGSTNEWFVVGYVTPSAPLDVQLSCVPNSDLPGAHWVTQSQTAGSSLVQEDVTAVCPSQERLVTGGEHIDSISHTYLRGVKRSMPEGAQAWNTVADVPAHDTLSVSVLCVPVGEPIASFTSVPPNPTNSTSATFSFNAVDPSGVDTASNWCFLNTNYLGACNGSYTVTGLTEGVNVFAIEATTPDGRGGAPTEKDYYFWVDLTKPTLSVQALPVFTLGSSVTLKATGKDSSGIDHYKVVETARRASGAGASTASPVVTTRTTTTGQLSVPVIPGWSYAFSVTAYDTAGNASPVRTVSTGVPLDNFPLTASSQWTLIKSLVYTHSIVSRTTAAGATLAYSMYGKTLGIVATTCPTCGQIGVYAGNTLLSTINLSATSTQYQQVKTVTLGATPVQAAVTLKVLSTGKLVEIDGLGARVT